MEERVKMEIAALTRDHESGRRVESPGGDCGRRAASGPETSSRPSLLACRTLRVSPLRPTRKPPPRRTKSHERKQGISPILLAYNFPTTPFICFRRWNLFGDRPFEELRRHTKSHDRTCCLNPFLLPRRRWFRVCSCRALGPLSCPDMAAGRKAGRGEPLRTEANASRPGGGSTRTSRGTR